MTEEEAKSPVMEMHDVHVAALRDPTLIVLEQVNWSVLAGDFWVVAGPQHSGKSDLLAHAAGLMNPVSGACRLFGRDTKEFDETQFAERQRIGFVFADSKLFNHQTIAENVALPWRYHKGTSDKETAAKVESLLELLQLTEFAKLKPDRVALAWRRRAALARALILEPELLLLDNPNGGLIERHRRWLVNFLDQLWRGHEFFGGRPMTIVTATDDLRAWEHPKRKFAALHAGRFSVLGAWGGEDFIRHDVVKELLLSPT